MKTLEEIKEIIRQWCEDATKLTGNRWEFIRIDQRDFEKYPFRSFAELKVALE